MRVPARPLGSGHGYGTTVRSEPTAHQEPYPGLGRFSGRPHHYSNMAACHAETNAETDAETDAESPRGRSKSAHGSGPSRAGLIN